MPEPKDIHIPGHLDIAVEAAGRLNTGDWTTNEVLVCAIADLESFVRTPPNDFPIIDAGPLDQTPITKMLVNTFESLSQTQSGKDSYGYRAITQIGPIVAAVKTMEVQLQQLGSRVAQLEQR